MLGQGSRRLVRAILSGRLDLTIRMAGKGDMEAVYELSNDPVVRANSINREPIPWDDHVAWYNSKIASDDCCYYLIFDGDRLAAQVRFDIEDGTALISISINETHRGRGLSSRILRETSSRFFKESDVQSIIAEIRTDNEGSVRAFEKAGYTLLKTIRIKGDPFYQYSLRKV